MSNGTKRLQRVSLPPGMDPAEGETYTPSLPQVARRMPAGLELAFCPTGEGGGIDNSCGYGGTRAALVSQRDAVMKEIKAARASGKAPSAKLKAERARLNKELLKADPTPTPKERTYGKVASSVKVKLNDPYHQVAVDEMFGKGSAGKEKMAKAIGMSDDMWESLGNPNVSVYVDEVDDDEFYVQVQAEGKSLSMVRIFNTGPDGTSVQNEELAIHSDMQGKGIGSQLLQNQVEELSKDPSFTRIETIGAGSAAAVADGDDTVGFKVWPKLGYDGKIPKALVHLAKLDGVYKEPADGRNEMAQLHTTAAGRKWWNDNGSECFLSFSLKPGSHSMKTLKAYQDAKQGIKSGK